MSRLWVGLGVFALVACASASIAGAPHNQNAPAAKLVSATVLSSNSVEPEPSLNQAYQRRLDAETRYAESYYAHLQKMNEITEGKFKWQDRASNVTLWLVVGVVISGVALSFFQIWIAFHRTDSAGASDTTIVATATSFRVTSSVVGIVILVISTAFLYLFLKEVYDIKVVSITPSSNQELGTSELPNSGPLKMEQFGLPAPDAKAPAAGVPRNNAR